MTFNKILGGVSKSLGTITCLSAFASSNLALGQAVQLDPAPDGPAVQAPTVHVNLTADTRSSDASATHYTFDCTGLSGRLPGHPVDPANRNSPIFRVTSSVTSGSFDVPVSANQTATAAFLRRALEAGNNCGRITQILTANRINIENFVANPPRTTSYGISKVECLQESPRTNPVLGPADGSVRRGFCYGVQDATVRFASDYCLRAMTQACRNNTTSFLTPSLSTIGGRNFCERAYALAPQPFVAALESKTCASNPSLDFATACRENPAIVARLNSSQPAAEIPTSVLGALGRHAVDCILAGNPAASEEMTALPQEGRSGARDRFNARATAIENLNSNRCLGKQWPEFSNALFADVRNYRSQFKDSCVKGPLVRNYAAPSVRRAPPAIYTSRRYSCIFEFMSHTELGRSIPADDTAAILQAFESPAARAQLRTLDAASVGGALPYREKCDKYQTAAAQASAGMQEQWRRTTEYPGRGAH